jgi:hypothetical protein
MRGNETVTSEQRQAEFDAAARRFTAAALFAAGWKRQYYGATYSSRLRQAVTDLRAAVDDMAATLERESE